MEITFDTLPQAVRQIHHKLDTLEQLLLNQNKPETDTWFDLNQLCKYLPSKPVKATVYTWVRERRIPFHKSGKKLAFLKSEIDDFIKQGRQKTAFEIKAEADFYLKKLKKR